ncbi:MDR family MFS transporter [Brevibacillus fluminis]|uniref:MDR family MFS transporter n=1 Tax=Brevibacillus fluminis TaxID=511487 RepID=UPI003F8BE6D0
MNRLRLFLQEFHPVVHLLLAGAVTLAVANCISILYLPLYLVRVHHIDPVMIGLIVGVGSLASMFGGFFAGTLSDMIGRRKVILVSLYLSVALFVALGMADHPAALFFIMILDGWCVACYAPVAKALMSDMTPTDKRMRVFSLRYVATNIGYAAGPAIGAYISLSGVLNPFYCSAVLLLVYTIALHICLNRYGIRHVSGQSGEQTTFASAMKTIARDKILLSFILGGIISTMVHGKWSVTIQQHLEGSIANGELLYGTLVSVNSVGVILLQYPLTRWAEKHSPFFMVVTGTLLFTLGTIGFGLSSGWASFIASMIVFTVGEILMIPSEFILIDRITPDDMRGTYYGAQNLTELGSFLGPVIGGLLLQKYGGTAMFFGFAAILLISLIFFRNGHVRWQKKQQRSHHTHVISQ